ncbi:MAG TPA: Hint domain-containing protein [Candidatus Omnitrophota bacterium]|nr:Hint domain-containing protein [Candidatus Omnitrophota bacterium]HPD84469.1 Hint domain-containing protein [Candidatus Omnitrophota bacterium]HRZ03327.1 Hint domain-containing protein [Candidatus Omnitrophota bacterium]
MNNKTSGFTLAELLITTAIATMVFGTIVLASNVSIKTWFTNKNRSELIAKNQIALIRISNEIAASNKNVVTIAPCGEGDNCVGNRLLFKEAIVDGTQIANEVFTPDGEAKFGAKLRDGSARKDAYKEIKVTTDGRLIESIYYDPAALCGNGTCDGGESLAGCPQDCAVCGDGTCSEGETSQSCLGDCPTCPDGVCGAGETYVTCPDDCPPSGGGGGCFLPNTQITMADGSKKPIQEIAVGDKVLSFDEKSKQLVPGTVSLVFIHQQDTDEFLIINDNVFVTKIHAFYTNGEWAPIGKMKVGDFITKSDLTATPIKDIKQIKSDSKFTTYNFEVKEYFNYIAEGYIVHNYRKIPSMPPGG